MVQIKKVATIVKKSYHFWSSVSSQVFSVSNVSVIAILTLIFNFSLIQLHFLFYNCLCIWFKLEWQIVKLFKVELIIIEEELISVQNISSFDHYLKRYDSLLCYYQKLQMPPYWVKEMSIWNETRLHMLYGIAVSHFSQFNVAPNIFSIPFIPSPLRKRLVKIWSRKFCAWLFFTWHG